VIGTNRDLMAVQRLLNAEIAALCKLPHDKSRRRWTSGRLLALQRKRIAICATLVNRRIEAAKPVVDLACWFNGNGALRAIENRGTGFASESSTFEDERRERGGRRFQRRFSKWSGSRSWPTGAI
jgi:hypothetical protein